MYCLPGGDSRKHWFPGRIFGAILWQNPKWCRDGGLIQSNVNTHASCIYYLLVINIFIIAFAMPCKRDKEALSFTSINYGLNPQFGDSLAEHTVSCRIIDRTGMLFGHFSPSPFDRPKYVLSVRRGRQWNQGCNELWLAIVWPDFNALPRLGTVLMQHLETLMDLSGTLVPYLMIWGPIDLAWQRSKKSSKQNLRPAGHHFLLS